MRDNKGFTLVELLAVIAILAIVALITTPAITSVINNSRKSAAQDKAWGTIESVKNAYATGISVDSGSAGAQDYGELPLTFVFSENDVKVCSGTTACANGTSVNIPMTGERPVSGSVTMKDTGEITCSNLEYKKNGHYTCTSSNGNSMSCTKAS